MTNNKESGLTLIELAIVILIASFLVVGAIYMVKPYVSGSKLETTKIRQNNISDALATFAQTYGRLPCPAAPIPGAEPFGFPRNSGAGGTNFTTPGCGVSVQSYRGILPFKVLGLTEEQAKDSYGNFMTYAVSPSMTQYDQTSATDINYQDGCYNKAWLDGNNNPKNPKKGHVCCPIKDTTLGEVEIYDAKGSTNKLFNPGPIYSTSGGVGGVTLPVTKTIYVKIIPDVVGAQVSAGAEKASNYKAPANMILYGRAHYGDFNAQTFYRPATLKAIDMATGQVVNKPITISNEQTGTFNDGGYTGGISYQNSVLIGRKHTGGKTGSTSLYYGKIYFDGNLATLTNKSIAGPDRHQENDPVLYTAPPPDYSLTFAMYIDHDSFGSDQMRYNYGVFNSSTTETISGGKTPPIDHPVPIDRMVAFALVSHGINGDGSLVKGSMTPKSQTTSVAAQESANAGNTLKFVDTTYSTSDTAFYFDDVVTYRTNDQLISEFNKNSCAGP